MTLLYIILYFVCVIIIYYVFRRYDLNEIKEERRKSKIIHPSSSYTWGNVTANFFCALIFPISFIMFLITELPDKPPKWL